MPESIETGMGKNVVQIILDLVPPSQFLSCGSFKNLVTEWSSFIPTFIDILCSLNSGVSRVGRRGGGGGRYGGVILDFTLSGQEG